MSLSHCSHLSPLQMLQLVPGIILRTIKYSLLALSARQWHRVVTSQAWTTAPFHAPLTRTLLADSQRARERERFKSRRRDGWRLVTLTDHATRRCCAAYRLQAQLPRRTQTRLAQSAAQVCRPLSSSSLVNLTNERAPMWLVRPFSLARINRRPLYITHM